MCKLVHVYVCVLACVIRCVCVNECAAAAGAAHSSVWPWSLGGSRGRAQRFNRNLSSAEEEADKRCLKSFGENAKKKKKKPDRPNLRQGRVYVAVTQTYAEVFLW